MKELDNILIIGIGNNTRQDDGLGWRFLELLEKEGFNTSNIVYKYQLMVEDAELIGDYKTVVFVDACKTELKNGFKFEKIFPSKHVSFSTHNVPPTQILNLCETFYNKKPKAYMLAVQGYLWDIEIGISKKASRNLSKSFSHFKLLSL
ncbi:hydrogenase maturation protease [uncultured Lutibacter sp.]|uniref:hydrogenase maturation protease n=1 Tax=uncultured Lutibacter sp. TaxID=437739 RepID=UPI002620F6D9|nr:hydrogenase maturation protease [uncultured Lutibacter sp.]